MATAEENQTSERETLLRKACTRIVGKCLTSGRFGLFARAYPRQFRNNPDILRDLHKTFIEQLSGSIKQEIDIMFEEENLVALLKNIEDITNKETTTENSAWRPSGNAKDDIRSHILREMFRYLAKLEVLHKKIAKDNKLLEKKVENGKDKLNATLTLMQQKVLWLQQCCDAFGEETGREVEKHMQSMEEELKREEGMNTEQNKGEDFHWGSLT